MRGVLETGFARVDGSLALLVQRSDQTDRALIQHGGDLKSLEKRVDALEADSKAAATHGPRLALWRRWPGPRSVWDYLRSRRMDGWCPSW
ncbi:hypothetical protein AB1388_04230 [Streptomyces hydrogenans]|uniref:hypothetical protein n=1 Tax=Streptomyces hydrogenans TaxID=1873719 RepID=UPI00345D254A